MERSFWKNLFSNNRPLRLFWLLFVPAYILVMLLISIPVHVAGLDLGDFLVVARIPLVVAAVFSLGYLKE